MKSKIVRTKSKLERATSWCFALLFIVLIAGYFLRPTGDALTYVLLGLGVTTTALAIASKLFPATPQSQNQQHK
jgi:hypothetical protein